MITEFIYRVILIIKNMLITFLRLKFLWLCLRLCSFGLRAWFRAVSFIRDTACIKVFWHHERKSLNETEHDGVATFYSVPYEITVRLTGALP